jgi:hypothetical protein
MNPKTRVVVLLFRAIVFMVGLSTAKATHFAIADKSGFLEAFPGASEGVYLSFLIGGVLGFISSVGLFYFQRWATWLFGGLALFVTILNFGVSAPLLHTLSGLGLTFLILILGFVCRERFR